MHQRVVLVFAIALAIGACQKKASGQTVAVVNDEEITAGELNDALNSDPSAANSTSKQVRADVLQKLIDRKLLVQQARKDGLDKSADFINQQRRANDELLINMLISKRVNTSQVPSADEVSRFEASRPELFGQRETWTLDQLIYPLPKNSTVTAQLGSAQSLDAVAKILTASGIQFTRANRKIDTAVFPHPIFQQLAKLKPGEPFIAPGPDKAVASVITAREPNPLVGNQAQTVAVNVMRQNQASAVIQDRVKSLRTSAKIQYQPGFGPGAK